MKQFYRIILSLAILLLSFGTAYSVSTGHMLDRIELKPGEKISYLSFKGFFDPGQFPHIEITSETTQTEFKILLPNTFINSVMLPEREIVDFPQSGILDRVNIEEKVLQRDDGKIDYRVNLSIQSSAQKTISLNTERSDSRNLVFTIREPKKKAGVIIGADGTEMVVTMNEDLQPVPVSPREKMLLHPITALMSYRHPEQLKIAVLNASPHVGGAQRLALTLDRQHKHVVEKRTGMKIKIVNISSVQEQTILPKTKIYFHANLLKTALILAEVLPGEQVLEPMSEDRGNKLATDVEIYVGKNLE